MEKKELIILGSGPAGLSAAIYARRAELDVLVIEKNAMSGGQVLNQGGRIEHAATDGRIGRSYETAHFLTFRTGPAEPVSLLAAPLSSSDAKLLPTLEPYSILDFSPMGFPAYPLCTSVMTGG